MAASLQAEYIEQLKQQGETERLDQITDDLRQSITSIGSLAALLDIQTQDASETRETLRETISLIQIAVQGNKTILDAVAAYVRHVQDEEKRPNYNQPG